MIGNALSKVAGCGTVIPALLASLLAAGTAEAQNAPLTPERIGRAVFERYAIAEKVKAGAFKRVEVGEKAVYFYQRRIGEAVVEGDFLNFQFDRATGELIREKVRWRDHLPETLPPDILSRDEAEFIAEEEDGGEIGFSGLFFIAPGSAVFPIDPPPENPCWVVESVEDERMTVSVIDAVTGEFLGEGVPPPYQGFSLSGPQYSSPCRYAWTSWYQNAESWFETMGFDTDAIQWPTQEEVQSHIQNPDILMFYELAHGGSTSFSSGCSGGSSYETTTAGEIESWISSYRKMPFAFIGSCGGLCSTGDNTLSYEFRKGSDEDTATVGYCDMAASPCVSACWYAGYTIPWQTVLFDHMSHGCSVKAAFDSANAEYPGCGSNNCMRFAGDESFYLASTDLDLDGDLDTDDIARLTDAANWDSADPDYPRTDVNGDGTADAGDLGVFMSGWGM